MPQFAGDVPFGIDVGRCPGGAAESHEPLSRGLVEVGPQSLNGWALRECPADGGVALQPHAVQEKLAAEFAERDPAAGQGFEPTVAEVGGEYCVDVGGADPAPGEFFAVAALGKEGLRVMKRRCADDGLLKWQVLEAVQSVLCYERVDRPLRRQEPRRLGDEPSHFVAVVVGGGHAGGNVQWGAEESGRADATENGRCIQADRCVGRRRRLNRGREGHGRKTSREGAAAERRPPGKV